MVAYTYKVEKLESGSPEYAIRYNEKSAYAKVRGSQEFKTDLRKNNTAYEVYLSGSPITECEYASF